MRARTVMHPRQKYAGKWTVVRNYGPSKRGAAADLIYWLMDRWYGSVDDIQLNSGLEFDYWIAWQVLEMMYQLIN